MVQSPDDKQTNREERARGQNEPLEPLVRLLARQLAQEHFAAATRQPNGEDRSSPSKSGSAKDE